MVQGAVALLDAVLVEAGNLELAVDVGREHEIAFFFLFADLQKPPEPRVRDRASIKVQAMAVEPPRKCRIPFEPPGVGHFHKGNPQFCHGRVGLPEPLVAPEVGQARVDAHAGACSDEKRIGLAKGKGGPFEIFLQVHGFAV